MVRPDWISKKMLYFVLMEKVKELNAMGKWSFDVKLNQKI